MADDFNLEAPNQERDLNNNGIPDIHEPGMQPHTGSGYQHQESFEVGRENTSGAPVVRHQREAMGHLGAAYTTANAGAADPSRRDRVATQNAVASALERKIGSDPDQAVSRPAYEQTLHDIDVERKRNAANKKKSSLPAELAATRPHKEDKAHGAEILTELFKGMRAGHKHATQVLKEQAHEQNQFEAEALKLRRANDQDLIDHELALAAIERKAAEQRDGGKAPAAGSEGTVKGPGDGGPGGGGDGGPSGGPGGPGPGETTTAEPAVAAAEQTPTPANDVGPEQAPGRVAAEAGAEPTVGSDVGRERVPGQPAADAVVESQGPSKEVAVEPKPKAAAVAGAGSVKEPVGAEATGSAGMGAVLATVNPALGIAATAAQTQGAQKLAGTDHASERQTGAKGPQLPGMPPVRTRAKVSFAPGQPARSLATPKPPAEQDRAKVIAIPLRASRQGGLHAQASGLPRPAAPVVSRAGPAAASMPRALGAGLGSSLLAVMKPVVAQNDGPSVVEQMHAQRGSAAGAGR